MTAEDDKTKRVAAPFNDRELSEIDAWGFARRIRNRSDAIKALIKRGLQVPDQQA